jgi:hypothetical protein
MNLSSEKAEDAGSSAGGSNLDEAFFDMGAESPHGAKYGSFAMAQGESPAGGELPCNAHDLVMWYFIGPLSVVGFIMNCMVFLLWNMEHRCVR